MIGPFVLLGIALLLIFLEFFLPGGILGIAGALFVLLSVIYFGMQTTSPLKLILFIAFTAVALVLLIRFALSRLKKGKRPFYLNTDQEGYSASSFDKELLGKEGVALSDLKPSGHIVIEGKRLQAISKTGYIKKGSPVVVIGGEGAHLIVKGC